jgi:DNA-binding NtrC family response regulator
MPMTKPVAQGSARKTAILAVSGNQSDLSMLGCLFAGSSWVLCTAGTLAEAGEWLQRSPAPVVLCESRLPDGDWKALLRMVGGLEDPPNVVVISRHADETLWVEALNSGAFDVLAGPTNQTDVFRALSSAWRSWKERKERRCAARACA